MIILTFLEVPHFSDMGEALNGPLVFNSQPEAIRHLFVDYVGPRLKDCGLLPELLEAHEEWIERFGLIDEEGDWLEDVTCLARFRQQADTATLEAVCTWYFNRQNANDVMAFYKLTEAQLPYNPDPDTANSITLGVRIQHDATDADQPYLWAILDEQGYVENDGSEADFEDALVTSQRELRHYAYESELGKAS